MGLNPSAKRTVVDVDGRVLRNALEGAMEKFIADCRNDALSFRDGLDDDDEEFNVMAMESESWECVEESTPRSESEDSSGNIIVRNSASRGGSNGRSRPWGAHPDRLYVSMMERMEQRKQRRHELEIRYECARKQQEEEKRAKEELKVTLEKLQRKATAEQNRAAQRRQKQLESESQRRRELLQQQRELASLHSLRRLLLHYGVRPWYRFLLQCRQTVETAKMSYNQFLMKRALKWLHIRRVEGKSSSQQRVCAQGFQDKWRLRYFWQYWLQEDRRGVHLHHQFLMRRSCKALREVLAPSLASRLCLRFYQSKEENSVVQILEYRRKLDRLGDDRNRFRLLSRSWSKWTLHVRKEKSMTFLRYLEIDQIAALHWQRVTYVRSLRAWKDGMGVSRYERKRMQHKAEVWSKVHFWLDELEEQNTGKTDSKQEQLLSIC